MKTPSRRLQLMVSLWALMTLAHQALLIVGGASPYLLILPFIWSAHGLLLTVGLDAIIRRVAQLNSATRWLIVGGSVLLLTGGQTLLDFLSTRLVARTIVALFAPDPFGAGVFFWNGVGVRDIGITTSVVFYFWVFSCYAVASTLLLAERRLSEARAAADRAELTALRFQLNPHLLFNALNSVSSLILAGRSDEADRANTALARFLRRSLESDPATPVTLDDEMAALDAYLDIERLRFGERLTVVYDVSEAARTATVPPYLLQPLLENAIKHGLAADEPGRIDLSARVADARLVITLSNSLPRRTVAPSGTGTGLRNVRARLEAVYGAQARMEVGADADVFRVKLDLPGPS